MAHFLSEDCNGIRNTLYIYFEILLETNLTMTSVCYQFGNYCHGIPMLSIASKVYKMELKAVDHLYDRELFDILVNLKTKRNLNLLRVRSKKLLYNILSYSNHFAVGTNSS